MDIIENADAVASYIDGINYEAFCADRKTIDASERCLQRITEAVIKIGKERMAQIMPALDANSVRGMGNALRHEYDVIDLRIIYNTIVERLPLLRAACAAALEGRA
ncbi:MAG: HepT-like ribonuclease domain-containing protein [Pseudomonadota bacterium]|uniref:HepT-like ribonuclease domain-containing protein n=1 Tax=Sphingobium sp. TaxID=1912891 RepID=UPI002E1E8CD6